MPRYLIFRRHILPVDVKDIDNKVLTMYRDHFETKGYLMTSFRMDSIIRKKWKRCDVWNDHSICITLKKHNDMMMAIQSESLDQYWADIKPSNVDSHVVGTIVRNQSPCPICLLSSGDKIMLRNCTCTYHRECIEHAVKYRGTCPVCDCTIYKEPLLAKPSCNENENDPRETLV